MIKIDSVNLCFFEQETLVTIDNINNKVKYFQIADRFTVTILGSMKQQRSYNLLQKKFYMPAIALIAIYFLCGCQCIVNSMAFHPDTENIIPTEKLPPEVQELFIETPDKVKLQSYFIENNKSDKVILYFHGNAGNLCHRLSTLLTLRQSGVNVFAVSYRGYGKSEGSPYEEGIYRDGQAALKYVTNELGFSLDNTYIMGRSIGSTVAINTSQNQKIAGLILVSPLTSGKEQAKASGLSWISWIAGDAFNNLAKAPNIVSPVLIIHGTEDRAIPYYMGKEIFNEIKTDKKLISIQGAGHNNISSYREQYWRPVFEFIK
jgi:pimeloyl-ACP methyl ester carboxylesterase